MESIVRQHGGNGKLLRILHYIIRLFVLVLYLLIGNKYSQLVVCMYANQIDSHTYYTQLLLYVHDSAVHEFKMTLPLKREKGNAKCGEIEIELNDLHIQFSNNNSTAAATDGHTQDNRTSIIASASNTGTQNGPTSAAVAAGTVAGGVASLADDFNLMQLETPETQRRTGSHSPATTTASTTTTGATSTMSTTSNSTNGAAQGTNSASDRQTGLAVAGTAAVAAVGGAATVASATGGNARVPTPSSPAPNPSQRTPTPQVLDVYVNSLSFSLSLSHIYTHVSYHSLII